MTSTSRESRSDRRGWIAIGVATLLLLLIAAGLWFWLTQLAAGGDNEALRLNSLLQKQKDLTAQLQSIGPPPPPVCKPGEVLEPISSQPAAQPAPGTTS